MHCRAQYRAHIGFSAKNHHLGYAAVKARNATPSGQ